MGTIEALDKLVLSGLTIEWAKIVPPIEETKQVRLLFYRFVEEFCIEYVYRETPGYYMVFSTSRKIGGLFPLSYLELFLFISYSSCVVFVKPSIELTKDFIRKVVYCYSLDEDIAEGLLSLL